MFDIKTPPHLESSLKDILSKYTINEKAELVYMKGTYQERNLGFWPKKEIHPASNRKGQSRKGSILEAILNVFSGAFIAFFLTELLAPSFGIGITGTANLKLTVVLTIVSVIRGYLWRRYFNGK